MKTKVSFQVALATHDPTCQTEGLGSRPDDTDKLFVLCQNIGHACIHCPLYTLFKSQHNSESETCALPHLLPWSVTRPLDNKLDTVTCHVMDTSP